VGTWEVEVPNLAGVARWVWDIHGDGTYEFRAEGPGSPPAHNGTFKAKDGKYVLRSTTLAWDDEGTYTLSDNDTLVATGKLGTGTWHRVTSGPTSTDSATPFVPDSQTVGNSLSAYQAHVKSGVRETSGKLSKHFWMTAFEERGDPDDHNHRSNVDGTSFAQNSRRIIFNAATDLPMTQLPKANEVRCTVVSDATRSREFETIWEERTSGVELRGLIDAPPAGRWAPGNYTFSCQTGAEPFLTWRFEVE
jgi:hypothetical protein